MNNALFDAALPSGQQTIELRNFSNSFVTQVSMPKFRKSPKVLIWGDRAFEYDGTDLISDNLIYKEVFAYFSPTAGSA